MTQWAEVFLGLIAAATVVMALVQVGAIIAAARVVRQAQDALGTAQRAIAAAQQTVSSVHQEIQPLIARATVIAEEASKTATGASAQVQKMDRLVTNLARRVDDTAAIVQQAIVVPAREGLAIMAAVRAAFGALRLAGDLRRRTTRSEEEDPLFIG